jgi:hypothetical protein
VLDEALFGEHTERLADRVPRHLEAFGEHRFGQLRTRRELAVDDALPQLVCEYALLDHAFMLGVRDRFVASRKQSCRTI